MPLFGLFHLRKAFIELIIKLFYQPGCEDFAHLDKIIKLKNLHSFNNGKFPHFKKVGPGIVCISIIYRCIVHAGIIYKLVWMKKHPNSTILDSYLTATKKNNKGGPSSTLFAHFIESRASFGHHH